MNNRLVSLISPHDIHSSVLHEASTKVSKWRSKNIWQWPPEQGNGMRALLPGAFQIFACGLTFTGCCKLQGPDWDVSDWGCLCLESDSFHQQPSTGRPRYAYRYTLFLYNFNYKKVVLLTEHSDDIARCTGGAGSIGVCCSDGKLILSVWEKSLENHGFHLDLLSYYRPIAVKVWPSGSNKAKIINN